MAKEAKAPPATGEAAAAGGTPDVWPDGTPIDAWFACTDGPQLEDLGARYVLTKHGILDDGRIHTAEIQTLIDRAAAAGGGVIVVPPGVYLTGSLFFKPGVNLYVAAGGMLRGSRSLDDYAIGETRIEGETAIYVQALINADGCDGFTMTGPGTIDGAGLDAWRSFWHRRTWNPDCTNKDEQRPRLVYISNSSDVAIAGLCLQNSWFWTTHIYRCDHVRYLGCRIFSPVSPVKAPSTDAIDIDACTDVLVRGCTLEVNDDSVVLKGGKGPWADIASENGSCERILIEDCIYGFCHGCLTVGSECVHARNVLVRRLTVRDGKNLLWIKMRPDTPQRYEYITMEQVRATVDNGFVVRPWAQFFDLKGRDDLPPSVLENVTLRDCDLECAVLFDVHESDRYSLRDITLERLRGTACERGADLSNVEGARVEDVTVCITGEPLSERALEPQY